MPTFPLQLDPRKRRIPSGIIAPDMLPDVLNQTARIGLGGDVLPDNREMTMPNRLPMYSGSMGEESEERKRIKQLASPDTQPARIGVSANPPNQQTTVGPRLPSNGAASFSLSRVLPQGMSDRTGLMNSAVELPVNRLQVDLPNLEGTPMGDRINARSEAQTQLAPYQPYLDETPERLRYNEAVKTNDAPDNRRRNFGQKLLHVLGGIGKGLALGGVGGAVAGGIDPGNADRAVQRAYTLPRLQSQAQASEALQGKRLNQQLAIEDQTGYNAAGPTAQERQRLTTNDYNRIRQQELEADRLRRLEESQRWHDMTQGTRDERNAQGWERVDQGDRRLTQYDTRIANDERYRKQRLDIDRWRARTGDRNAATSERRAGAYQRSVDQSSDAAEDRRMNHEDTYGLNLAGKKDKLAKLRSDLAYAQANHDAKDKVGNPLFPQGYVQSLQRRVDDLDSSLQDVEMQHGRRRMSSGTSHPPTGKIMQLPDGRKIRVKRVEGGQVTDYEYVQ